MGQVTDKFRTVCNTLDGLPDYPVSWLPELYAVADELDKSIKVDKAGQLHCTKSNVQQFISKFATFQKKFLGCK